MTPAELRLAAREGRWTGSTAGLCPGHQQANVVMLPAADAAEFASFCSRNPKPCPVIEILAPGEWEPARSAPAADVRTDVPSYRVYRNGGAPQRAGDVTALWTGDMVTFLLGCSFTFEHALTEAGVPLRHISCGTTVPMFESSIQCAPAGRFRGPMVVTMRPVAPRDLPAVLELSARYPHAHGSPVHAGDPAAIGITNVDRPDYGDPVEVLPGEIPVFWACGVTPQAVVRAARPALMIAHEPGRMFVTDLPRELA